MSILSDKEIKDLCATEVYSVILRDDTKCGDRRTTHTLYFREGEFDKYCEDNKDKYFSSYKLDKLPEPMISPFVGEQVRTRRETIAEYQERANVVRAALSDDHPSKRITLPIDLDGDVVGDTAFNYYADNPENFRKVISHGLSSYGYDVRIGNKFKIFTNINSTVVDPLAFDEKSFVDFEGDVCIIPPNSFVLAHSLEYFRMPEDVTGIVLGKSTYARCGNVCIATPLEAGWHGIITLEFANTTPLPMKLYANQGAAQVLFFKGSVPPEVSYAARNGKYQGQTGITLPRG